MGDVVAWGALIAGAGVAIAAATFWVRRGSAEASTRERADAAMHVAKEAKAEASEARHELVEVRLGMAREYLSIQAHTVAENRTTAALEGLRTEVGGINSRLDRVIERRDERRHHGDQN